MKSLLASTAFKMLALGITSLSLAACGNGADTTTDNTSASSQEQKAIASMVVDVPQPVAGIIGSSEVVSTSAPLASSMPMAGMAHAPPIREFNPADFPDSCNDYIDEVLQCIKVMDEAGMEGTASMQMQLSEMQASWLKQTDTKALEQTCRFALIDMEPVLRDLGC